MNFYSVRVASSSNMSSTIASSAVELYYKWGFSIQAAYAGSAPSGQLFLRGSNDDVTPTSPIPTTWTNITGTTAIVSGAGTTMWDSQFANYRWVQMVFQPSTAVSSSGILTAIANVKGV